MARDLTSPDRSHASTTTLTGMSVTYEWRGAFTNDEVNALHAEAFETRVFDASEWDWEQLTRSHSLGWVVARVDGRLVGFVNVLWDGLVHAWIQDVMVAAVARRLGTGRDLVAGARDGARSAGCEWLHVDFEDHLKPFYLDACGFTPTNAGVIALEP
jgi:GNAT superfamily N-acetyltransferase